MRIRELFGAIIVAVFVGLFVYMMNLMTDPGQAQELGNYVIIVDLILGLLFFMAAWGPLINGEPLSSVTLSVPSWIGIPVGVAAFVYLYVSGLGELLLHVNEVISPLLALSVAGLILGGATLADRLAPHPEPHDATDSAEHGHGPGGSAHGQH